MHTANHKCRLLVHQKLLPQHHVVPDHWDKSKTADDSRLCSLCSDLDECERLWEWQAFFFISSIIDEHLACWWEGDEG